DSTPGVRRPELRPVDTPGVAHANPDQGPAVLGRRCQREMVQVVDPGVEAAGMRRSQEAEPLAVEEMAELVQEGWKEAAVGRHFPEHRRAHPDPDPFLLEVVVTEELGMSALPDAPRPGPEDPQSRLVDLVGSSEESEDRLARRLDTPWIADGDRRLKKPGAGLQVAGPGEGT